MTNIDPHRPTPHEQRVAEAEREETGEASEDQVQLWPEGVPSNASSYQEEVEAEQQGTTAEQVEDEDDREKRDRGTVARWYNG